MSAVPKPSPGPNPLASARARVRDVAATPTASPVLAEPLPRLGAAIVDGLIFSAMVYIPLLVGTAIAGAAVDTGSDASEGFRARWDRPRPRRLRRLGLDDDHADERNGAVDRQEDAQHQGRAHRRLAGVAGPHLLAAQRRELAARHHPALRLDRRAVHLRGVAASVCTTSWRTPSSSRRRDVPA